MVETSARRQRRPKRPRAYAVLLAVCGLLGLGGAWATTRAPALAYKIEWRGKPAFIQASKARDARAAAP